jgi:hypothetical protein
MSLLKISNDPLNFLRAVFFFCSSRFATEYKKSRTRAVKVVSFSRAIFRTFLMVSSSRLNVILGIKHFLSVADSYATILWFTLIMGRFHFKVKQDSEAATFFVLNKGKGEGLDRGRNPPQLK